MDDNIIDRKIKDTENVDEAIQVALELLGIINSTTLVERIKTNKKASDRTVRRSLKELSDNELIVKIEADDFSKYCLDENDRRLVFYAPVSIKYREKLKETLFQSLSNDSSVNQRVLEELYRNSKQYNINSKDLDIISDLIKNKKESEIGVLEAALVLLDQYVRRGIIPKDIKNLKKKLEEVLETTKERIDKDIPYRFIEKLIKILCLLEDDYVINFLIRLSDNETKFSNFVSFLTGWEAAQLVIRNEHKLIEKQLKLNKDRASEIISIRNSAHEKIGKYNNNILLLKKALEKVKNK